jgi:hypothetical protein
MMRSVFSLYSLFGDGEGQGLHCLYVSRHLSVKPMEFCGTNVAEFPSYIVY